MALRPRLTTGLPLSRSLALEGLEIGMDWIRVPRNRKCIDVKYALKAYAISGGGQDKLSRLSLLTGMGIEAGRTGLAEPTAEAMGLVGPPVAGSSAQGRRIVLDRRRSCPGIRRQRRRLQGHVLQPCEETATADRRSESGSPQPPAGTTIAGNGFACSPAATLQATR